MANPIWNRENAVFGLRLLLIVLTAATALTTLFTLGNYPLYSQEQSNAEACHERFGPTAEYVGETSRVGDPAVICEAAGETHFIPRPEFEYVPVGEYIDAILDGRA